MPHFICIYVNIFEMIFQSRGTIIHWELIMCCTLNKPNFLFLKFLNVTGIVSEKGRDRDFFFFFLPSAGYLQKPSAKPRAEPDPRQEILPGLPHSVTGVHSYSIFYFPRPLSGSRAGNRTAEKSTDITWDTSVTGQLSMPHQTFNLSFVVAFLQISMLMCKAVYSRSVIKTI